MKSTPKLRWRVLLQRASALILMSALLLAGLPPAIYAQDVSSGLEMWLALDENADGITNRVDSSGNNHNGTCAGQQCPTAGQPGKVGDMADFDGQGQRLATNLNAPAGSFTLAGWVRYGGAAFNNWHTIFEFGDDQPWFGVSPSGSLTLYPSIFGGKIPVNQWTYVAYTWDGAQSRLYVNGAAVASNNAAPPVGGQGMLIGAENGAALTWQGSMDELRVYNRALSENEVKTLAGAGVVNVPPATPPPAPPPPNETARLVDLSVSIYKSVTTAEARKQYEDIFALFADGIFEASNGSHKIRNINFYDNGRFSDRADIQWIQFESQPRASTNAYGRGTVHMGDAIFGQDTTYTNPDSLGTFVTTLVHEWGHYFYGVLDEYRKPGSTSTDPGSPQANDTPPIPESIMDAAGALDFNKMNFSTRKSTLLAGRTQTAHYRVFQASGWETLSRNPNNDPQATRGSRSYWPDLAAAAPGPDADASVELPAQRTTARSALKFNWVDTSQGPVKIRMFLVDISADMGQNNKLASAKAAMKSYIERANIGDRMGVITFADAHTVVQPLTLIDGDATKAAIQAQIDAIAVNGGTNNRMADAADQAALNAIKQVDAGGLITDRSVFVIIDGGFTDQLNNPWVVQKFYNEHQKANIPISVFNFAAQSKGNDIFGNMVPDNMSFPPQCCQPAGVYRFVGQGGFEIPAIQSADAIAYTVAQEDADFDDLIDAWEDVDQQYSDVIDVNLGTAYGAAGVTTPFTAQIYADSTLDALEVDVYFSGAPDDITLTLIDPNGDPVEDPVCDGDGFDSFCFFYISEPAVGVWTLEALASDATLDIDYEAHGYVYEGFTYQANVESSAGDTVEYPEEIVLVASVKQVERIAKAGLNAWVEGPDGEYSDLSLNDDGVAPDEVANDGRYTGFLPYNQPGDYYVTALFDNIAGEAYYTQAGMNDVNVPVGEDVPDDFDRFATLELYVNDFAADDYGNDAASAADLVSDNADRPGRIDKAGDADHFRITSPQSLTNDPKASGSQVVASRVGADAETFVVRLTSFAFGMNARVKITTSAGSKEYTTGPLAHDAYWAVPVQLTPGEQLDVQVTHVNGQAATGSYSISFGPPLPGEVQPNTTNPTVYLPLVTR